MFYIDTDDYAASGIETFTFPGGEPHANVPAWPTPNVHIFAKIRSWNDFGYLVAVTDALYSQGVSISLFMPYLPGARQDRNTDGLTPLTPRIYSHALNRVRNITACDPHSIPAVEHYNEHRSASKGSWPVRVLDVTLVLADLVRDNAYDFILCPDRGAYDRANEAATRLGIKRVLTCEKKRDFETGKLSGFKVPNTQGGYGLLVDDICDGGGTFAGIAETYANGPTEPPVLDLFVTHGIFSKGLAPLSGFINIYTTNSFYQPSTDPGAHVRNVHAADLVPYYFGGLNP